MSPRLGFGPGYRIEFFAGEIFQEPAHVHVTFRGSNQTAKYWLDGERIGWAYVPSDKKLNKKLKMAESQIIANLTSDRNAYYANRI